MPAAYIVGIDLGTTNSVVAYAPVPSGPTTGEQPAIQLLPIPQLVAPSTIEARSSLPSFLYLAGPHDQAESFALPWGGPTNYAVGEWARRQSAERPDQTIGAAKSWLCYSKVDRHAPILPWGADDSITKISPVTATRRFLEHLVNAWNHHFPGDPLADQQVVLTVPASFDASARELTREAAFAAGLPANLVLLEEPQAAVYAWLATCGDDWRRAIKLGETLLVCDVGGGTTDLTLVGVAEEGGELFLKRMAVGHHLLIGGDNMDLAIAHQVSTLFEAKKVSLDPWQSVSLWHSCRAAKEALLASPPPKNHTISVLGRGSKLIGGTVSVQVEPQTILQLLLEGFFPPCNASEEPSREPASGFQEIGLPFENEPAITKHLASFLAEHATSENKPVYPTHVLFNGGVFKAHAFQERLLETIASWYPNQPAPQRLSGTPDLDHSVAKGAAYYGWAKQGGGVRIRGGTARSYYIGIETAGLAVPGAPRPLRSLCVVPFGMEEGTSLDVPADPVGLIVGRRAKFRFFSSSVRKDDQAGSRLTRWSPDELEETDSLEASLDVDPAIASTTGSAHYVPVQFHAAITELGVLELSCIGTQGQGRWKLEFSVRKDVTR